MNNKITCKKQKAFVYIVGKVADVKDDFLSVDSVNCCESSRYQAAYQEIWLNFDKKKAFLWRLSNNCGNTFDQVGLLVRN